MGHHNARRRIAVYAQDCREEEIAERTRDLFQRTCLPAYLPFPCAILERVDKEHVIVAAFDIDRELDFEKFGEIGRATHTNP